MYAFQKARCGKHRVLFPSGGRHRLVLDDPGAMGRIDLAEVIGRIGRNGIAAIHAGGCVLGDGHSARLTGFLICVVVPRYRGWSKTHDLPPFFLRDTLPSRCFADVLSLAFS